MSIAGFDPCGGAGILADIKTFESIRIYGVGVCTSITYQNAEEFSGLNWISYENITKQIDILLKKHKIDFVKIGLIENLKILDSTIDYLLLLNPGIKIIWDPIFKSSTDFNFHDDIKFKEIENICKKIYLITPNINEIVQIYKTDSAIESAKILSKFCNVFLKGGHSDEKKGYDYLFTSEKTFSFRPKVISEYSKHGSGCVLSSAITANLAKGFKLNKACLYAKYYITKFLKSNSSSIGYHKL